ncbi:hypothetical protein ABT185_07600 [Streptomyces clavifer]|uniref:hypothetical protein n=1 Tax=Streptomyces clavifer TaxID=68188 RepID=UPI003326E68C
METTYFLLTFDRKRGKLLSKCSFKDQDAASVAYAKAERSHRRDNGVEVVLVGADSEQTLRHTHGHYFDRRGQASESPSAARFFAVLA